MLGPQTAEWREAVGAVRLCETSVNCSKGTKETKASHNIAIQLHSNNQDDTRMEEKCSLVISGTFVRRNGTECKNSSGLEDGLDVNRTIAKM